MIDLNLFRHRVGVFNQRSRSFRAAKCNAGNCIPNHDFHDFLNYFKINNNNYINLLLFIIYLYYMLIVMCVTMSMAMGMTICPTQMYIPNLSERELLHIHTVHVKILYVFIIWFLIKRVCLNDQSREFMLHALHLSSVCSKRYQTSGRFCRLLICSCFWFLFINFMLITIVNPNMLNPGPLQNISVVYHNAQGLIPFSQLDNECPSLDTTKIFELNSYLTNENPGIFILNETWLKKSILDNEIIPTNDYKVFRLDRTNKTHPPDPNIHNRFRSNGGGVLIGIRRDLDVISTKIDIQCKAEILGVTLKFNDGKKIIICTCYRVGTLGSQNHSCIDQYLRNLRLRRGISNICLVGDFNLPHTDWQGFHSSDSIEQLFINSFSDLGFTQLVNHPTHNQGNILDVVLTNNSQLITDTVVDSNFLVCKSDHSTVRFNIKSNVRRKKPVKREIYNFKRADWAAINEELRFTDWNRLLSISDIDVAWNRFKTKLFECCNRHIPKIKIKCEFQPPWYDAETHDLCRQKERLHSRYKQTKSTEHYAKYSDCRRQFKRLVKQKMKDNLLGDDNNSNSITKKFWSYVKSKSNSHRIPEHVFLHGTFKSNAADQVELFNTHFYNQFSEPSIYNVDVRHVGLEDPTDIDINHVRIRKILLKLNANKAQGPDGIHGKILKICAINISYPLSLLFKLSYRSSSLPDEWKLAHVVPVHKKGSKANVENYRPISLTSLVMKAFERIIRDELMFRCSDLLDQRQHGFLPGKSCCTQLVGFCDSLALSLNKNIRSDVIYFDFARAFDSVNHDLILHKLKTQYHIDGLLLKFLVNYLKDRKQSVVIGNHKSLVCDVVSGVPQGSIIGPSLFILFLNDITEGLSPGTNINMYADDTKIWREINYENDHITLQNDIDYLMDWALLNKMKFHPSKCKVVAVSNLRPPLVNVLPEIQFFYTMGHNLLDYCDVEKDLGLYINGTLNWSLHCDKLYAKANQMLGLLKRTCHFVDNPQMKRTLYLTLVRSQFEHCPIIWKPSASTSIDRLESIQKRSFKWILDDEYVSYSLDYLYHTHCKQLNILPIRYRFDFHDLKFFHSVVQGYTCVSLPDYLKPFNGSRLRTSHLDSKCFVSEILPRNAQSSQNFTSTSARNFGHSYFYRAHLAWNKLPLSIREIENPTKFKTELLKYIWNEIATTDRLCEEFYLPDTYD